jgi:uncharacterized protein
MLASLAEAAAVLEREDYAAAARRNASFLLTTSRDGALLLRSCKDKVARLNAYLEDYAFLIDGLLALYQTTGETVWFKEAVGLADKMITEFWDEGDGGFYFTGQSHKQLIVRAKDYFDNATPSGNSVAAEVLLRLSLLTGNERYRTLGVAVLRLVADQMKQIPSAFGRALEALDYHLATPTELALVGPPGDPATKQLAREIWRRYLPNKVVALADPADHEAPELIPLLRNRSMVDDQPTAYVCESYTCQLPVNTAEGLRAQLLQQGH